MNTKNILSWLLLLFGEAIIITTFILFRGNLADNILVLNIVFSTIIYGLVFLNYSAPWIDLQDKSHKRAGALGISWVSIGLYVILAITTMVMANVCSLVFSTQLLIHCGLLFFLFLGLLLSQHAADKVEEIHKHEQSDEVKNYRERIEAIKNE